MKGLVLKLVGAATLSAATVAIAREVRAQAFPSSSSGAVPAARFRPGGPSVRTAGTVRRTNRPIPGQYLVVFDDAQVSAPSIDHVPNELAARHGGQVFATWRHALRGFAARMSAAAAAGVANDPRVAWVEEDGVVEALPTQTGATWGLDRIDQRALPLDGNYTYFVDGSGVNAYIIDTGIRTTHSEFGGRAIGAFTAVNDGNGTNDCNGHGTHVAGTVGGATYGVAKNVRMFAVRVLDCTGSGTVAGVVSGVDWVTNNHVSPAVANMSLGGGASATLDQAVNNSIASGVTYAIAAGNSNADACNFSPARVANAITVAASDINDARATFSNFGTCVRIFGPGVNITSSWSTSDTATATISGTSMATPHVAGTAALYLSTNPSATPAQVASTLVANATSGALSNVGPGSPNLLVFEAFIVPFAASLTPAVASWTSGRLDVFARGISDGLFHEWWQNPGPWSAWEPHGGGLASKPVAVSWGPGRLDVFIRGTDNALWHKWWQDPGPWSGWEYLGGVLTSDPAVVSWGSGRLDVFIRSADNALWHKWWQDPGPWSDWEFQAGGLSSNPAAVSWGTGRLDVFIRGTDNALWHKWWQSPGPWSGWEYQGGALTSDPAAVSWGLGRLDVFVRGLDNGLYHKWFQDPGPWSDWEPHSGGLTSNPVAVSWSSGRLDVFVRGLDNGLYHKWWQDPGPWSSWEPQGGGLLSDPAAVSWGSGRLDVFVVGTDNGIWHKWWQNPGPWSGWEPRP